MNPRLRLLSMSTILAVSLAGLVGGPVSAQDPTTMDCAVTSPEENLALVTAYVEAHDVADQAMIDELLHDGFVDNGNRHTLEIDESTNDDEHQLAVMMETLYPGSEHRIDEIKAFDDQVLVVTTVVVTAHTLTADGTEVALDEPAEMSGMSLFTIECGQIASAHTVTDLFGLMTTLGFQLAPPAP